MGADFRGFVARLLPGRRAALVAFVALAAALNPIPQAGAAPAFVEACQRLLKIYFKQPEFVEKRAKEFLPQIEEQQRESWKKAMSMAPEQLNGLSLEQARRLLESLKGLEDPTANGKRVRNETYFVPLGGGQSAVVKKIFTRVEMGESKVYRTTNNPKYEVLAFAIDRYLGTNLVAPAVMLEGGASAQLRIRAGSVNAAGPGKAPENLLEMSHTRLLDVLIGNGDRGFSENLLVASVDGVSKTVAIDFDLSRPLTFFPVEAAEFSLSAHELLLEPKRKVGKHGYVPGVFSKPVIARLRALDRAKIIEIAAAEGLKLSEDQITAILAGRYASLTTIDAWISRYGENLILIP